MSDIKPRMGRSLLALLVGFVLVVALSIATDAAMRALGIFPPLGRLMSAGLYALATFYRTIIGVVGSYITAWLAPDRPEEHALGGGMIGLAVSTAGAIMAWNAGPTFGPHWYPISLIILALPTAWLGGKLYVLRSKKAV